MRILKQKINNSYESENSSGSASSYLDESAAENVEEPLAQLNLFQSTSYSGKDFSDKNKVPNKQIFTQSQESEYHGFSSLEQNLSKPGKIKSNKNKKIVGLSSSQMSNNELDIANKITSKIVPITHCVNSPNVNFDFLGFSKEEIQSHLSPFAIGKEIKSVKDIILSRPFKTSDARLSSNREFNSKNGNYLPIIEEMSSIHSSKEMPVFDLINSENSCNAVDANFAGIEMKNKTLPLESKIVVESVKVLLTPVEIESKKCLTLEEESSQYYKITNERSPDLFADEDEEFNDIRSTNLSDQVNGIMSDNCSVKNISAKDCELLKRIQNSLSGVPPPPSLTTMDIDMFAKIFSNKEKILNFFSMSDAAKIETVLEKEAIFKPSHSLEEINKMNWPDILSVRHHGLCYNLSTVSERVEMLSLSVVDRYIGCETSSSFQCSPSSAKKRNMRLKMLTQSPGCRLSHLAKRRAIFSSANLQNNSQKIGGNNNGNKQILLDVKKSENRRKQKMLTPKRRTPGKRKIVRKSSTSSARKLLFSADQKPKPAATRETSKRALFQSPPQQEKVIPRPVIKPEIANRVEKSKRALFSPEKPQSSLAFQNNSGGESENCIKRKWSGIDIGGPCTKISRMDSFPNTENLTPKSLKIKSQSFCMGFGGRSSSSDIVTGKSLFRTTSDTTFSASQLSESHKKKLLWAVSQALQSKQISVKHSDFKNYASVLARVVKRLFMQNSQKSDSTSDTMLRLAKKYVFSVMQGKSVDDIYLQEKDKLEKEKQKNSKLTGYICPEEYENRKLLLKKCSKNSLYPENSMESFGFSQSSGCLNFTGCSQSSTVFSQASQDNFITKESSFGSSSKLPIQSNPSLNNSSSKNNLGGIALRENIDFEPRRSGQKNFTGKDQRNLSPYIDKSRSSAKKFSSAFFETNSMKVKRQISFDS